MIAITTWMEHFLTALHKTFGDRISFIGLQGSYARGEASDTSDIDVVVILDSVSAADLKDYRAPGQDLWFLFRKAGIVELGTI